MRSAFLRIDDFLAKYVYSHPIFRSYTPTTAHYAFSEPWIESKIKTVTVKYPAPTFVTEKLVATILEKEMKTFKEELSHRTGSAKSTFTVIENKITSIKLNGYEVDRAMREKSQTVDVSICLGAIPTEIRDAVALPSAAKIRPRKNFYASFSSAVTNVIRHSVAEKEFMVLDILGPMTQAFIVRHGLLAATITIPVGDDMLVDAVAKQLSVSRTEAISQMKMFFREHVDDTTANKMKKIVTETRGLWRKQFEISMNDLAENVSVPPNLFVIARSDESPFFVRVLRRESVLEFGVDRVQLKQTLVTEDFLKSKISIDQDVSGDLALSLLSAYFTSKYHYKSK